MAKEKQQPKEKTPIPVEPIKESTTVSADARNKEEKQQPKTAVKINSKRGFKNAYR